MTDRSSEGHEFVTTVPPHSTLLSINIELVGLEPGGCLFSFTVPETSSLLADEGSAGRALASARDVIVRELDTAIALFKYDG